MRKALAEESVRRFVRRFIGGLAALFVVIPLVVVVPSVVLPARPATAQQTVERVAGPTRFDTAAELALRAYPGGATVALVASGLDFPDALAAGPAAARRGGPVLLVGSDHLPSPTAAALDELGVDEILVLGGEAAVSDEVVAALERHGTVERVAGRDRYATAATISARTFAPGAATAYVASGTGFPDALAGGPAAIRSEGPVLLVTRDDVPSTTAEELRRLSPGRIVLLGGRGVVSDEVAAELEAFGPVERVAGGNRFETAVAVSARTFSGAPVVHLATGLGFPDALGAVTAAGRAGGPVLLVAPNCVPDVVRAEIERLSPERIVVVGGTGVLGEGVERLQSCASVTTVIATGLRAPWDVAFGPDGRAWLTERDTGALLVREANGSVREVQRIAVNNEGEGGLLGVAVSPGFAEDGMLYAYYTTTTDNRVVRFRPGQAPEPVLTGIPRAGNHNGGRIGFGPDGMLYVATGDAAVPSQAQDRSSLAGKILRITPDGGVPAGNPFPGSPVWSYGHRNVQGLAWDRAGRLYATEFGPDRNDEINRIQAGGNYGWPVVTGTANQAGFVDPIVVRQPSEASWSGAAVLVGGAVSEWEGSLLAAGLRGRRLWRFALDGAGNVTGAEALFVNEYGRLRHVAQAPDGSVWILTNNRDGRGNPIPDDDRIIRIGPPT